MNNDTGETVEIRYAFGDSALGTVLAAESDAGLCAVLLDDDRGVLLRELERRFRTARLVEAELSSLPRLLAFIEAPADRLDLPLDLRGTEFQRRVWQALMEIPAGATASYSEVAARVNRPDAVRAVAGAIGANHLAVVVPCHRAIRLDGSLSGYHWGVDRKRALLALEAKRAGVSSS